MPTLEERVAYIEGQMAEQSHAFAAVRESLARLEQRMDARFDALDRRFFWIVGIQITTLVAVVGAVLSRS